MLCGRVMAGSVVVTGVFVVVTGMVVVMGGHIVVAGDFVVVTGTFVDVTGKLVAATVWLAADAVVLFDLSAVVAAETLAEVKTEDKIVVLKDVVTTPGDAAAGDEEILFFNI